MYVKWSTHTWLTVSTNKCRYDNCYFHHRMATQSLQGMCGWEEIKDIALPAIEPSPKSLTLISKAFRRAPVPPCSPPQCTKSSTNSVFIDSWLSKCLSRYITAWRRSHILIQTFSSEPLSFGFPQGYPWPNHSLKWGEKRNSVSHWFHTMHSSLKVPHCASQWSPCICCTLSTSHRDEHNRPIKWRTYQWGHRPMGRGGRPNLPFFLGNLTQTTSPQWGLPWPTPLRQWWPFLASWVLHPGPTTLQSTRAVSSFRLCAPWWKGFYGHSALCTHSVCWHGVALF